MGLDGLTNALDLVGGRIVHDDDTAGIERRGQAVFHVGFESEAIHGAVDDEWGADPITTQAGDEGRRLPVTMGNRRHQPFAPPAPPRPPLATPPKHNIMWTNLFHSPHLWNQ